MSPSTKPFFPSPGGGSGPRRVLFLCVGNACRSQMAEGFARAYGSDAIIPASAGFMPALAVARNTIKAMDEKNIDLRSHFPKSWRHVGIPDFDLVVNMSGAALPPHPSFPPVREWSVADPVAMKYKDHCRVRDQIEHLVMQLILELRRGMKTHGA